MPTIVSALWDFDDGTTSTELNPLHSYEVTGLYYPRVTVTDSNGSTASRRWGPIYIHSSGLISNLRYDFGDGQESSEENPLHSYSSPGVFTARLMYFDEVLQSIDLTIIFSSHARAFVEGRLYLRGKESTPGLQDDYDFCECRSGIMLKPSPVFLTEINREKLGSGEHGKYSEIAAVYAPFTIKVTRLSEWLYFMSYFLGGIDYVQTVAEGIYKHYLSHSAVDVLTLPTFSASYYDGNIINVMTHCMINSFTADLTKGGNGIIDGEFSGFCNLHHESEGELIFNTDDYPWVAGTHDVSIAAEPLINYTGMRLFLGSASESTPVLQAFFNMTVNNLLNSEIITQFVDSIVFGGDNGIDGPDDIIRAGSRVVNSTQRKDREFFLRLEIRQDDSIPTISFLEKILSKTRCAIEMKYYGKVIGESAERYGMSMLWPSVQFEVCNQNDESPIVEALEAKVFQDDSDIACYCFGQNAIPVSYNDPENTTPMPETPSLTLSLVAKFTEATCTDYIQPIAYANGYLLYNKLSGGLPKVYKSTVTDGVLSSPPALAINLWTTDMVWDGSKLYLVKSNYIDIYQFSGSNLVSVSYVNITIIELMLITSCCWDSDRSALWVVSRPAGSTVEQSIRAYTYSGSWNKIAYTDGEHFGNYPQIAYLNDVLVINAIPSLSGTAKIYFYAVSGTSITLQDTYEHDATTQSGKPVIMDDGYIIVPCHSNGLKIFNPSFQLVQTVDFPNCLRIVKNESLIFAKDDLDQSKIFSYSAGELTLQDSLTSSGVSSAPLGVTGIATDGTYYYGTVEDDIESYYAE